MEITAQQLFHKLVNEYKIIGEKGLIQFTLKDLTIEIETKDTVGNLIQEWIKAWMKREEISLIPRSG